MVKLKSTTHTFLRNNEESKLNLREINTIRQENQEYLNYHG